MCQCIRTPRTHRVAVDGSADHQQPLVTPTSCAPARLRGEKAC